MQQPSRTPRIRTTGPNPGPTLVKRERKRLFNLICDHRIYQLLQKCSYNDQYSIFVELETAYDEYLYS